MSEEITFRYLNSEQQEHLYFTMLQVNTSCGLPANDTSALERDICQQFSLLEIGYVRPEQVNEVEQWMVAAWMTEQLDRHLRNVYARQDEITKEVQITYLLANRQRTLLANQFKRTLAVVLTLLLFLEPAFAFRFVRQDAPTIPPINADDPQAIYNAIAQAPKVSAYVDANFVFDCVKGFPENYWGDAYYGAGASGIATEVAATLSTPRILILQSGYLILTYFGDWTGPKMLQRINGFTDRVPPRDEGLQAFNVVWQNLYTPIFNQQHRGDPRDQNDCQACMRSVVTLAHQKKELVILGAKVVFTAAAAACTAASAGYLIAICIAAAAAGYVLVARQAELDFQEKILNAKNGACAVDRKTGQPCQWER